ncbi:MAG: prepilin-type N-terminal cleavage/methylation domain-containing protein [Coriobacteriales bacterium]|jgi:prepilin-type N-terminal cleavage/methylation domain-containing protein|nr:prepilin-type N-terminal cleavage/methylation domain-containing protein [Coriobacteriales bacterium]
MKSMSKRARVLVGLIRKPHFQASSGTQGFTLVELIVAMLISVIVFGAAAAILISSLSLSANVTQDATYERVADAALDFVEERATFATAVTSSEAEDLASFEALLAVTEDPLLYIGDENGLPAERGWIYYRRAESSATPQNIFGESFYQGGSMSVSIIETKLTNRKPAETITVILYDRESHQVAQRTRTVYLINGALSLEDVTPPPEFKSPEVILLPNAK